MDTANWQNWMEDLQHQFGAWARRPWGRSRTRIPGGLHRALDLGVNFFDPRRYGDGRSERLLAQLRRVGANSSTSPPSPGRLDPTRRRLHRQNVTAFVERSLKIWRPTPRPFATALSTHAGLLPTGGVRRPGRLVKAGKLQHYGVSVERSRRVKAIEYPGWYRAISFNCFGSGLRICFRGSPTPPRGHPRPPAAFLRHVGGKCRAPVLFPDDHRPSIARAGVRPRKTFSAGISRPASKRSKRCVRSRPPARPSPNLPSAGS